MKHFFKYSYPSETVINASAEEVWVILTDTNKYSLWNNVTTRIDTNWKVGEEVFLTIKFGKRQKEFLYNEYLLEMKENEKISWGKKMLLYQLKREQVIQNSSNDKIKYSNTLTISGLISPIINLVLGKITQRNMEIVTQSLKNYAERNSKKQNPI